MSRAWVWSVVLASALLAGCAPARDGVAVERVELGGLWWSPEQLRDGVWTPPDGAPKNTYVRFTSWVYNDDQDPPYPDVVDVVCRVRNGAARPLDLRVSATAEYKALPYEAVAKPAGGADPDRVIDEAPWRGAIDLGTSDVVRLAPGSAGEATVRGFDVRRLTDDLGAKGEWPWRVRITTRVSDDRGVLAERAETFDFVPGD